MTVAPIPIGHTAIGHAITRLVLVVLGGLADTMIQEIDMAKERLRFMFNRPIELQPRVVQLRDDLGALLTAVTWAQDQLAISLTEAP